MRTTLVCSLCVVSLWASAAVAATTTSISQFGITWTFASPVEYGQFANGDYWVVGPVQITGFSPASINSGGNIINGSMINPVPQSQTQGFDSRMSNVNYVSSLNVAYGVSAANPRTVQPHSSVLSSISLGSAQGAVILDTVAILTVLPSAPAAGSFRPAYCPTTKPIRYNVSDLDYGELLSLAPQGGPPALSTVEAMFRRPWIEYVANWPSRMIHPKQNMPDYGREISSNVSQAAMSLHLNYTNAQKETLLIRFVQVGIDFYGVVEAGGTSVWVANGGHMHGRKWPILFAGLVLNDTNMQNVQAAFHEDQQTYTGASWHGSTALWRIFPGVAYLQDEVHPNNWLVDGRGQPGDPPAGSNSHMRSESYRHCCTSYTWVGQALAAHLMGAVAIWDHQPYFDYVDRWMTQDWTPHAQTIEAGTGRTAPNFQGGANPSWTRNMWIAYRGTTPTGVTADAGPDQTLNDIDANGFEVVTLDGTGSSVPSGTITGYLWTEGGSYIGVLPVQITVLPLGVHTITLQVTSDTGATDTDTAMITVKTPDLVADAGEDIDVTDTDGDGIEVVGLNGSGSYHTSLMITGYLWSEGARLLGTTVATPAVFTVGEHIVTLKVTASDGEEATDTTIVNVLPPAQRAGDCDGDNDVDLDDFTIFKSNFGSGSATHAQGDFDGDSDVDLDDFALLKNNFGT